MTSTHTYIRTYIYTHIHNWRRKHDSRRGTDLPNPVQIEDDAMDKWQQDWANSNSNSYAHTEHRRMDQEKTRPGELLCDSVVNGPRML